MDLATIIGLGGGLVVVFIGIFLGGGNIGAFINLPSVFITFGGAIGATIVSFPMETLSKVPKILRVAFFPQKMSPTDVITLMVQYAQKARREGLLALEEEAQQAGDDFLQKGIQLVVDGTDPELVRNILEVELIFLEERHKTGRSVFEMMASVCPAFGMIGTLIGLIQMLGRLNDPSTVGPGMAVALLTTFYGALGAYLVFTPLANKLKLRSSEEVLLKQVMIEGILSIQAGENPRIVEEKLKAFLEPKQRELAVRQEVRFEESAVRRSA